jgi:hypothetical protein
MKYALLILVALAACNVDENFPATLTIGDTGGSVSVEYDRGTGHDFIDLKGTINGIDLGQADISEGGAPEQVLSTPTPSSAMWWIDAAKVGSAAHLVIDDDGDELVLDATIDGANAVVTDCTSNLTCY